jgi:hypothetical protein
MAPGVIKFSGFPLQNSFARNIKAMKSIRTKKLKKRINTVYDYNRGSMIGVLGPTHPVETDPTTVTATLITTTAHTYKRAKC